MIPLSPSAHAETDISMKCTYEDFGSGEYFEWNGTFKNLPTDAVVRSNGEEIGEIHFSGTDAVTFTAYTQKKDSYKAYRDELTDLPRSGQQPTDSIPAPKEIRQLLPVEA